MTSTSGDPRCFRPAGQGSPVRPGPRVPLPPEAGQAVDARRCGIPSRRPAAVADAGRSPQGLADAAQCPQGLVGAGQFSRAPVHAPALGPDA
ncbi:hypothetical protein ACWC2T_22980 [Streptomyces sp. NPDC001393]